MDRFWDVIAVVLLFAVFGLFVSGGLTESALYETVPAPSPSFGELTGFALYEPRAAADPGNRDLIIQPGAGVALLDSAGANGAEVVGGVPEPFTIDLSGKISHPNQVGDTFNLISKVELTYEKDILEFTGQVTPPPGWRVTQQEVAQDPQNPALNKLTLAASTANPSDAVRIRNAGQVPIVKLFTVGFKPKVGTLARSATITLKAMESKVDVGGQLDNGFDVTLLPNQAGHQTAILIKMKYYKDSDNDGFGVGDISVMAPRKPDGHVPNRQDCKDTDDTVWPDRPGDVPGAREVCDGKDNDCNANTRDFDPVNPVAGQLTCATGNWQCGTHYTCGNMYLLDCNNPDGVRPGQLFIPETGNQRCVRLDQNTPFCNYETGACQAAAVNCPVGGGGGAACAVPGEVCRGPNFVDPAVACVADSQVCKPGNFVDPSQCQGGGAGGGACPQGQVCKPTFTLPAAQTPACGSPNPAHPEYADGNDDGQMCDAGAPYFENCGNCPVDCGACPPDAPDTDTDGVPDIGEKPGCENDPDCDDDGAPDYYDLCPNTNGALFSLNNGKVGVNGCLAGDIGNSAGDRIQPDGCFDDKDVAFQLQIYGESLNKQACLIKQ